MSQSHPPELPVFSQPTPAGTEGAPQSKEVEGAVYNVFADKIGGVPNLRKKDNLFQAKMVGVFLLLGCIGGWLLKGWPEGVAMGAFVGLVAGTLISGFVLMIIGLRR